MDARDERGRGENGIELSQAMRANAPLQGTLLHRLDQIEGRNVVRVLLDQGCRQDIRIQIGLYKPANLRIRSSRLSRIARTTSNPGGTLPV